MAFSTSAHLVGQFLRTTLHLHDSLAIRVGGILIMGEAVDRISIILGTDVLDLRGKLLH